tara:strand:+ start:3443 stop:4168 length:726 start_codon:yes stop_codon:yes gene_type:complete
MDRTIDRPPFEVDPKTQLPIGPRTSSDPAATPLPVVLQGQFVRLEPLEARHDADLLQAASGPSALASYRYLADPPPHSIKDVAAWREGCAHDDTRLGWAVVDTSTGRAVGYQFLMRIRSAFRSIEIGNVRFGPELQRTPGATEAVYLFARHVFDDLGHRRFEWKCDALNAASCRAATRFGFTYEGTFRRDMILKGRSRDTAWFSMIDEDWPRVRAGFEAWLSPANLQNGGIQVRSLEACRD